MTAQAIYGRKQITLGQLMLMFIQLNVAYTHRPKQSSPNNDIRWGELFYLLF
jgi:hypothetical protein